MTAPRIRITSPAADDVRAWLHAQPDAPPPYPAAGSTRDAPTDGSRPPGVPAGWNVDHRRVRLGEGEAVYDAARAALMAYVPLDIGWVWPVTTTPHPEPDARGAMLVRAFGLTWVNAWRIVYVDDDLALPDGTRRTAFAYGTLEAHAERGEERFMVELRPDGSVWYDVLAFSRPHHWLARLGGPVTRWVQKRFGPASVGRMLEVVGGLTKAVKVAVDPQVGTHLDDVLRNPRMGRLVGTSYVPSAVLARTAFFSVFYIWLLGDRVFGPACIEPRLLEILDGLALFGACISMTLAVALAMPFAEPIAAKQQQVAEMVSAVVAPNTIFLLLYAQQFDHLRWGIGLTRLFYAYCAGYFMYVVFRHGKKASDVAPAAVLPMQIMRASLVLWTIASVWLAIDGFQLTPLGFPPLIVRLTAIHFHYAGFILPVIAATLARAYPSRLANAAAVAAVLGVPSTAIGITAAQLGAPHIVEALFALPMVAGALLVAAVHLGLAFRAGRGGTVAVPTSARVLRGIVAVTLLATMALALAYALRGWLPWSPTIPQMAMWHGIGNAFGVATCGLVACWLDPATQPPVGGIAPSAATAAAP